MQRGAGQSRNPSYAWESFLVIPLLLSLSNSSTHHCVVHCFPYVCPIICIRAQSKQLYCLPCSVSSLIYLQRKRKKSRVITQNMQCVSVPKYWFGGSPECDFEYKTAISQNFINVCCITYISNTARENYSRTGWDLVGSERVWGCLSNHSCKLYHLRQNELALARRKV